MLILVLLSRSYRTERYLCFDRAGFAFCDTFLAARVRFGYDTRVRGYRQPKFPLSNRCLFPCLMVGISGYLRSVSHNSLEWKPGNGPRSSLDDHELRSGLIFCGTRVEVWSDFRYHEKIIEGFPFGFFLGVQGGRKAKAGCRRWGTPNPTVFFLWCSLFLLLLWLASVHWILQP